MRSKQKLITDRYSSFALPSFLLLLAKDVDIMAGTLEATLVHLGPGDHIKVDEAKR